MTTNNEALQKIFEAALKQPDPTPRSRPKPATPTGRICHSPNAVVEAPTRRIIRPASTQVCIPESPKEAKHKTQPIEAPSAQTPVLDDKASDALAAVLEKKMARQTRKHKTQKLVTILVLVGTVVGSVAWFVSSPERVKSLTASAKEIRSATDVNAIVGSYEKSLDKVSAHGSQLDQATAALGVSTELKEGEDGYMNDEMQKMTRGEGPTVGDRAKAMQSNFGDKATEAGGTYQARKEISKEESFSVE